MKIHPLNAFTYCPKCGSQSFSVNDFRSKKCQSCGFTFYLNAASSVVAVIMNDNDEIIVTRRAFEPQKNTLDLPGGFVEFDESAEDALRREVHEELGIEIKNIEYLFSIPNVYPFGGLDVHTLDLVFLCKQDGDSCIKPDDDVANAKYMKLSELEDSDFGLNSIRIAVRFLKNSAKVRK